MAGGAGVGGGGSGSGGVTSRVSGGHRPCEFYVEIELARSIFASPDSLAPFECHTNFPSIYILTAHLFRHHKYLYIAPGNPRAFAHT